ARSGPLTARWSQGDEIGLVAPDDPGLAGIPRLRLRRGRMDKKDESGVTGAVGHSLARILSLDPSVSIFCEKKAVGAGWRPRPCWLVGQTIAESPLSSRN